MGLSISRSIVELHGGQMGPIANRHAVILNAMTFFVSEPIRSTHETFNHQQISSTSVPELGLLRWDMQLQYQTKLRSDAFVRFIKKIRVDSLS
jgi:hypothetical protein